MNLMNLLPCRNKISESVCVVVFVAITILTFASELRAAVGLSGWRQTAFSYYKQDKNEQALEILKQNPGDRFSKILRPFVYHQIWVYTPSKDNKTMAKESLKGLKGAIGFEDIDYLVLVGEAVDKPDSSDMAKSLLKNVFSDIKDVEAGKVLTTYIGSTNPDISQYALKSMENLLETRREIVSDGGNLRDKDIALMTDRNLLDQLAAIVSQTAVNGKQPTHPDAVSRAIDCLQFIEEPALKVLDKVSGPSVSKAEQKINEAMNKRKKNYPNSTWYSARGVKR